MPFPSLGCRTCKQRRIKVGGPSEQTVSHTNFSQCDDKRPICGRCSTSHRTCDWETDEEDSLPFKTENDFAQGRPRRPRNRTAGQQEVVVATSSRVLSPQMSILNVPIEDQAMNHWQRYFASWPNDDQLDVGQEHSTYTFSDWDRAQPDSSVRLAWSALTLALFGRIRRSDAALRRSETLYAQSIVSMREELKNLTPETFNQVLVATRLMGTCEIRLTRLCRVVPVRILQKIVSRNIQRRACEK
jgi:hypothetical protein